MACRPHEIRGHRAAPTLLLAAVLLSGCAATISCPEVDGDTRAVVLLDHGDHASLVIERADGMMMRYSYGDRRWYAEDDTGIGSGFAALFARTDAVLSRREIVAEPTAESVRHAARFVVANDHLFTVEASRADALIASLEAIFHADPDMVFYSDVYDLEFAPHPVPYTAAHNSNHVVAGWLGELGCATRGSPMVSNWRVTTSAAAPPR